MSFLKPHIKAYIAVVKKFTVFEGRAGRREFWMFFLYNLIICVVFGILSWFPVIGWLFSIITGFLGIAIFVVSLAVGVRRLHDTNRSGLLWLLVLIPLVGIIIVIVFWAQKGTSGANKYGSVPKAGVTRKKSPKISRTRKSSSKKQSKR
jgi:uncharacterized membrane protein YhaH (DUF805 family)